MGNARIVSFALHVRNPLRNVGKLMTSRIALLPRRLLCTLIAGYQATLSPDHGPMKHLWPYGYCRHDPTCSEFARRQVLERGAIVGSLLGLKRILTCHPWEKLSDQKILHTLEQQRNVTREHDNRM